MGFKDGFVWGAASASYQIEGAWNEDGKGMSIWDTFSHTPGKTTRGETGDEACDSYHRYADDVSAMSAMGLRAYRFSISWPRIMPSGRGPVNEKGFAYYDRLVDLLLSKGITPYITLFHWDMPQALQDEGGWQNRKTAEAFGEFAAVIAKHFAGRVRHYMTINEPQCFIGLGYGSGIHAPGLKLENVDLMNCMHNALLAHGYAVGALRKHGGESIEVGIASTGRLCYPAEDTAACRKAADTATFAVSDDDWSFTHSWFLDPAVFGHYPETATGALAQFAANVPAGDWDIIRQPLDYIGINVYNGGEIAEDGSYVAHYRGFPRTALKWPVTPEVMRCGIESVYKRYGLPIYITENGQSCNDKIFLDGGVHDPDRIDFLHRYLIQLKKAADEGCDVAGYFHWSLCDNYEWHSGYNDRFGIVYVDYPSQRRIIKDSGRWYADVIRTNGVNL